MEKHYRQGDLLFIKEKSLPEKLKEKTNSVIQEGELTGHEHKLVDGKVYEDESGNVWITAEEDAQVIHEEHDTIELGIGSYSVRRQRELSGEIID